MRPLSLFAAALLAAPLAAPAQAPSDSAIRSVIKERVDAGRFAGIVVGVISPTGKRRVVAYGPAAGVTPFDGNTVFEIGSITKTFTASILADMVKKGELSLSDPVEKFLPNDPDNPCADCSVQQMYDFPAGYTLPRAVGSQYEYSNLAVGLLGHALALRFTAESIRGRRGNSPQQHGTSRNEMVTGS